MKIERIDPNYFENQPKPYTVTADDFDMIIQHSYQSRELVSQVLKKVTGVDYSWKTNLDYPRAFVKMFREAKHTQITKQFMDAFMAYNSETRDAIVLVGGLSYEKEFIDLNWSYKPEEDDGYDNIKEGTICRRRQYKCPKCSQIMGYPMGFPFCQHNPEKQDHIACHGCGHRWDKYE